MKNDKTELKNFNRVYRINYIWFFNSERSNDFEESLNEFAIFIFEPPFFSWGNMVYYMYVHLSSQ